MRGLGTWLPCSCQVMVAAITVLCPIHGGNKSYSINLTSLDIVLFFVAETIFFFVIIWNIDSCHISNSFVCWSARMRVPSVTNCSFRFHGTHSSGGSLPVLGIITFNFCSAWSWRWVLYQAVLRYNGHRRHITSSHWLWIQWVALGGKTLNNGYFFNFECNLVDVVDLGIEGLIWIQVKHVPD